MPLPKWYVPARHTVGHRDNISATVTIFLWSAAVDEFFIYVLNGRGRKLLWLFLFFNNLNVAKCNEGENMKRILALI